MFVTDFGHTVRLKDKTTLPEGNEKVEVTFQVYYDFGARSKRVGFYLPDSPKAQLRGALMMSWLIAIVYAMV